MFIFRLEFDYIFYNEVVMQYPGGGALIVLRPEEIGLLNILYFVLTLLYIKIIFHFTVV